MITVPSCDSTRQIRADYETEEVAKLAEKIRNGLGSWLTFVTEPEVDSTNNRAERALREQVVMRKIFDGLRWEWSAKELNPSKTGVRNSTESIDGTGIER